LRRIEAALAGSEIGGWIGPIALTAIAFDAGGATAVGVVLVLRTVPPALAAPVMGVLGDRFSRSG